MIELNLGQDDNLTADDGFYAAQKATTEAKLTNIKYQRASEKAQEATLYSMSDCTEMAQDAAIRAHNHAARIHDVAAQSGRDRGRHREAKFYHEIAIKVHEVIKARFIRARHVG